MIQHRQNRWFHAFQLPEAAIAVAEVARKAPTRWLGVGVHVKYVDIRVDMRTGDFCFIDNEGNRLDDETIEKLFPQLGPIEQS